MIGDNDTHNSKRRVFLKTSGVVAIGGLLAGCSGNQEQAQTTTEADGASENTESNGQETGSSDLNFPTKPIEFIVPYGPGGGYDFYTRSVAKVLQEEDLIPVGTRVRNVDGAAGITGTNQVWNAEPDGHTLMIMNTEAFALAQLARPNAVQFNLAEMTHLPRVAGTTLAITVAKRTGIETGDDFIQTTENGDLTFGDMGPTDPSAIQMKSMAALGGIDFTIKDYQSSAVHFDSRGELYTAIQRGDVDVMAGSFSSLRQYVEDGELRFVLTYTKEESCPSGPGTETCSTFATMNANIQNVDQIISISGGPFHRVFGGPPKIPDARHKYLCNKISEAIQHPSMEELAAEADRPILYGNCETASKGVTQTIETYNQNKDLLREMGLLQ